MDNFNNKKINPNTFIQKYNTYYNKSFVFKSDMKNKKEVSFKTLIASFLPILHNDWKKSMKVKKGGFNPVPTDTIKNAVQQDNLNNFFNYFPRNPEFTNVNNKADLSINQVANQFPEMSTYSRGSF
jgi:phage pi2 protein 07